MTGISYRPEIDGLRAIAVSAVVLYHAGIGGAGYVGVDVFFVISGYLITSLLLREWESTARIDLLAFYARRVRRIFPAAVVVVLTTLSVGAVFLSVPQQVHLDNSAGAALVFGANIFFQLTSGGYFDGRAEEMPLLHLWSLSVEEQFYFIWPALLILILRYRTKWLVPSLVGLGVASLGLTELLLNRNPEAAFYQMPARFWELAAGGLIASLPMRALPRHASAAGVLLTLAACVFPLARFPGVGALPAVLGTCLVIAAVHGGAGNVFLRSSPMVGIGLISYSLYLWHWPLLALYRATSIGEGSLWVKLQLCAIAVLLAIVSYRYIEQPFRRLKVPKTRTVAIGSAVSVVLALSACALGFRAGHAAGSDDPMAIQTESDRPPRICHSSDSDPAAIKCVPTSKTRIGIWGDSMAYAWSPMAWTIDSRASAFTRDACGPFLEYLPEKPAAKDLRCRDFNGLVAASVRGLDTLYLVARWEMSEAQFEGLARTLDKVAPDVGRVVILGPTPQMRDEVGRCIRQHDLASCAIARTAFDTHATPVLAELRKVAAAHANVTVLDPTDYFCTALTCAALKNGRSLYWDRHHVSMTAAREFASEAGKARP